jgi:hypothetical protein
MLLMLNEVALPATFNQCKKLPRDISMLPLRAVPSTVPSRTSTRSKSKITSQFGLGRVASFVTNLKGQALARQSTSLVGLPMLSHDVEGSPMNDIHDVDIRPHPICAVGWARRLRKDGPKRGGTKQAKRIRVATDSFKDTTKTRALLEIDVRESDRDDNDTKSLGGNDDTSHAEVPSDSTYCEGDE